MIQKNHNLLVIEEIDEHKYGIGDLKLLNRDKSYKNISNYIFFEKL